MSRSSESETRTKVCVRFTEKTPSFHVHPDKGFFHCFGCNVGGDVFVSELHEKVGFQDAVRMLAQKTVWPFLRRPTGRARMGS
jgi:DNA primase